MADLLQILKGTGARPRVTFYANGLPSDLDAGVPTVVATRPDGTVDGGAVSGVAHVGAVGSGTYEFTLAVQPDPTLLTVTWAGNIGGVGQTLTTFIEVLGGLLFTLPELRALKVGGDQPFSLTATPPFTDAQLMEARAATLDEFESFLGFSPVPRHAREVHSLGYHDQLILERLFPTRLLSVTVAGAAQPTSGYFIDRGGRVLPVSGYTLGPWGSYGYGVVAVEYQHGWNRVKGDGSVVAMLRAAMRLQPGISSTARSVTTPDGVTYDLGDMAGQVTSAGTTRRFGIPAIDSWLLEHRQASAAVA
jgi:hypothetical protein